MAQAGVQEETNAKEYVVPAVLLGIGVLVYLGYAVIVNGVDGILGMLIYLPIRIAVQVTLGVVACFITAKIMGTGFGDLKSAIIKLAAIFMFPGAVTFFIPYVGWLMALVLYWGMLEKLFELEAMETIVLAVVIWLVNLGAIIFLGMMGLAMMH
jgi:hypothetical protein